MKTTKKLKTITLAASAVTLASVSPALEAVDWDVSFTTTITSGGTYDYGNVGNAVQGSAMTVTVTNGSDINILYDCYLGSDTKGPVLVSFHPGTNLDVGQDLYVGYSQIVHASFAGAVSAYNIILGGAKSSTLDVSPSGEVHVISSLIVEAGTYSVPPPPPGPGGGGGGPPLIEYLHSLKVSDGRVTAGSIKVGGQAVLTGAGEIVANGDFLVGAGAEITVGSAAMISTSGWWYIASGAKFTFNLDPASHNPLYPHVPIVGSGSLGEVVTDNWHTDYSTPTNLDLALNIDGDAYVAPGTSFTLFDNMPFTASSVSSPTIIANTGQEFSVIADASGIVVTAVPEPSTYALLGGVGVVALALLRRRRNA